MKPHPKSPDSVPSKIELLYRLAQLQRQESTGLFTAEREKNASNLAGARQWYDVAIKSGKEQLEVALLHNKHHEQPIDIGPIVQILVNTMFMQSDVLDSIAEYASAKGLRKEASELAKVHLGTLGELDAERTNAISLIPEGRFNEALNGLMRVRDELLIENQAVELLRVTIDIVDILQWLGDYARASSELSSASGLLKRLAGNNPPDMAGVLRTLNESLANIMAGEAGAGRNAEDAMALYRASIELGYYEGLINRYLRRYEAAERNFNAVMPAYRDMGVGAAIEFQLAAVDVGKKNYPSALKRTAAIEPQFRNQGALRKKLAPLLKIQAEALARTGKRAEALRKLDEAIQDLSRFEDPDQLWRLLWLKGQVLEEDGKVQESLESYISAANVVNGLRRAPLGYRLDSTYLKDKIPMFESAIFLASREGRARECCELMEMIKSRILTAALSARSAEKTDLSGPAQKVDTLTREIEAVEFSIWRDGATQQLNGRKQELIRQRGELLERIRISDPRWRHLTEPIRFDFANLSKFSQKNKTVFLNLFYTSKGIVAVLIHDGIASTKTMEVSSSVREILDEYVQNLQATPPYGNTSLQDPSTSLDLTAEQLVPEALLKQAIRSGGLVISPHGVLHLLPWAGLMFGGKRLFEYLPVSIVPNLSCVSSLSSPLSASPRAALLGPPDYENLKGFPPLPGARKEIEEISECYSKEGRLIGKRLQGADATEEAFWNLAGKNETRGGILHIACHGLIDTEDPLHSGLIFSQSRLDAAEVARASLQFDEVILSACSTGWRPREVNDVELSGDDILGMPSAFLEAGVQSVLVSIPPADDDATSALMLRYHKGRLGGMRPMAALRTAQKEMLEESVFEPSSWIGFTLYGCQ